MSFQIGLIGTGARGKSLANIIHNKLSEAKIHALADKNEVRMKNVAKDLDIENNYCFGDYGDLLSLGEIDAVMVTTPDYAHIGPVTEAIKREKNVFCEKVMATTVEDCTKIVELANEKGIIFFTGHNMRFNETIRKMNNLRKEKIDSPHLVWAKRFVEGSKYWHRWHRNREKSGGLLAHKGSHSLDLMNLNANSRPSKVVAFGGLDVYKEREDAPRRCLECPKKENCPYSWDIEKGWTNRYYREAEEIDGYIWDTCVFYPGSDVFDNATVMVDYEDGVRGTYMECHFAPIHDKDTQIGVIGDRGIVIAYPMRGNVVFRERHTKGEENYSYPVEDQDHSQADGRMLEDFLDCIENGKQPESDVEAGWDSAVAGILAQNSAEKNGQVYRIMADEHKVEEI